MEVGTCNSPFESGAYANSVSDIHMGNILFCYPNLDNLTPQEITSVLGEPVTGLVARTDGTSLPPNAPTYVVEPTEYTRQFPEFSEIQLIDFGEGPSPAPVPGASNWY